MRVDAGVAVAACADEREGGEGRRGAGKGRRRGRGSGSLSSLLLWLRLVVGASGGRGGGGGVWDPPLISLSVAVGSGTGSSTPSVLLLPCGWRGFKEETNTSPLVAVAVKLHAGHSLAAKLLPRSRCEQNLSARARRGHAELPSARRRHRLRDQP